MSERPLRIIKAYKDPDSKYEGYPGQQKKVRQVELIPGSFPGAYEKVIVEKRVYNVDAPHPDNRDW